MNWTSRLNLYGKFEVDDGCWEWRSTVNAQGYGQFCTPRRVYQAHRAVYELVRGPVPADHDLHHECRNRRCVRPDHLTPLPHGEHARLDQWNANKTHCVRGHEFTEENTYRRPGKPHLRQCRTCIRLRSAKYHQSRKPRRKTGEA